MGEITKLTGHIHANQTVAGKRAKEQALALTPTELRIHLLNSLSLTLQKRFEKSGLTTDLDRIVETKEQMVERSAKSTAEHANCVNNLANALQHRYHLRRVADDLECAIFLQGESMASIQNSVDLLETILVAHFIIDFYLGDYWKIDRAISMGEETVTLTPRDNPDHPTYLYNLGTTLRARFIRTQSVEDLDRSIFLMHQKSVELTSIDSPYFARRLNYLDDMLQKRYELSKSTDDIERVISIQRKSITTTANDNPKLAEYFDSLGVGL